MTKPFQYFGIVGAGAWGTALASTIRRAGRDVTIWAHNPAVAAAINHQHENVTYLPGHILDPAIGATHDMAALSAVDVIVFATPAQHARHIARELMATAKLGADVPVIITSKGIELGSSKLMGEVLAEEMPQHGIAILSGPCFAHEVAAGKPTALTLATHDQALGKDLAKAVATASFRPYLSGDIIGAQLGGAVKNVLAIASGIVTGKSLGENARAALITRGLAEMMRLGSAMGAHTESLMGLSGLGDLLLTCSSPQSRNMALGIALGQGQKLDEYLKSRASVAEGVPTAAATLALTRKRGIDMPIVTAIAAVLDQSCTIDQAIADLLARPLRGEAR